MLGDDRGTDEQPAPRRFAEDALVLVAGGLTVAALASILAIIAVEAQSPLTKFGDRVLQFDQAGPFGQLGYGLLALAALALRCVDPVDAAARRLVGGLRVVVGVVAAAAVVVSGYGVVAFATDAAIGHTQLMSDWGPAFRTGAVGLALSSLLLAACALWLVARRPETVGAEPEASPTAIATAHLPSWGVVSGAAVLSVLGALALVELVAEPVFRSTSAATGAALHTPFITRLDAAGRAFGSYPIAVLTFAVVGMVVAARRCDDRSGARLLALASGLGVLGLTVAVFVVVRVVAHRGGTPFSNTGWDRTQAISSAVASGLVAALAWMVALRFGTAERRDAELAASSRYRAPSVSTIRVASALVGAATVGLAMYVVSGYAAAHNPLPFGVKTDATSQVVMITAAVALGAALLAELARDIEDRWIGRAFLAVVAGAALFLGAYACFDSLLVDHSAPFAASSQQRHLWAALGAAAAFVALAVLSLIVNGLREEPEAEEAVAAELEAA